MRDQDQVSPYSKSQENENGKIGKHSVIFSFSVVRVDLHMY